MTSPEGRRYTKNLSRTITNRIKHRLTGSDFNTGKVDVQKQVDRLVEHATLHENLCQCYIGWCPFW
ncbi:FATC domain protein [Cooperia oncophora]